MARPGSLDRKAVFVEVANLMRSTSTTDSLSPASVTHFSNWLKMNTLVRHWQTILRSIAIMTQAKQENEWDTNFGWWTDKPEKVRTSTLVDRFTRPVARTRSVWAEAALVVGLMLALVLSLISLATRLQ